ncbi:hypothetical protein M569_04724, partial [Genlisea aurea]
LFKNLVLPDPFIPYASILCGVMGCKLVYDLVKLLSTSYVGLYTGLTKIQRIEWNNRGMSTVHAVIITAISFYFVFLSELFAIRISTTGVFTLKSSHLSTFTLGVSVGYFVADLAMICWFFPCLGGLEYILHHSLSAIAVAYSALTGEGQVYTFMVLLSEVTTPGINLRWFLDVSGLKKSSAYLVNGVVIFVGWVAARVLLFVYIFRHVYLHRAQVMKMQSFGSFLVMSVPLVLASMNVIWFGKILKGLRKTI